MAAAAPVGPGMQGGHPGAFVTGVVAIHDAGGRAGGRNRADSAPVLPPVNCDRRSLLPSAHRKAGVLLRQPAMLLTRVVITADIACWACPARVHKLCVPPGPATIPPLLLTPPTPGERSAMPRGGAVRREGVSGAAHRRSQPLLAPRPSLWPLPGAWPAPHARLHTPGRWRAGLAWSCSHGPRHLISLAAPSAPCRRLSPICPPRGPPALGWGPRRGAAAAARRRR